MPEEEKKAEEQGASTRMTPEDHVEIRISGTPEAVAKMMEQGLWRKEGCEVVEVPNDGGNEVEAVCKGVVGEGEETKTEDAGGQEKEEVEE